MAANKEVKSTQFASKTIFKEKVVTKIESRQIHYIIHENLFHEHYNFWWPTELLLPRKFLTLQYHRKSVNINWLNITCHKILLTATYLTGVVFDNLDGNNMEYTIRPAHEVMAEDNDPTWDTDKVQPRFQIPGPRVSPK